MDSATPSTCARRVGKALLLTIAVCLSWAVTADRANAGDGRGILRFDPLTNQLVPVAPGDAKVGNVYSHFSERLNRRVWSYLQPSGDFWYAMGEGTTQQALRLDVNVSRKEGMTRLEQIAPRVASRRRVTGRGVYFRLDADDRWVLADMASHATIFNAETGHRWESVNGKYIPVVSSYSNRWIVHAGRYVPMGSGMPMQGVVSMEGTGPAGGCRSCEGGACPYF
ncbi:MAG TPA: hypothetical protein VE890_14070 [Thermoguttaceae bacterium]|nr:hypothetical protein [Thermoguttaceae bacterium]